MCVYTMYTIRTYIYIHTCTIREEVSDTSERII